MNVEGMSLETVARTIATSSRTRKAQFISLPLAERSAVFALLSTHVQQELLKTLTDEEAVELLDHLDPHHAHLVLARMRNLRRRKKIIKLLKRDVHAKVEQFLNFHPLATTSLVHLNYLLLPDSTTIGETAELIEGHARVTGKIPVVLASKDGTLIGEARHSALVRERNTAKIGNHIRQVQTLLHTATREEVIDSVTRNPHEKIVILDTDGSVLGLVYSDDINDLFDRAPAAALYDFAGVSDAEKTFDGFKSKVRRRYKWLILNLATAFLAASVVSLFQGTLEQLVVLAIYMPIVAGMGGNAAAQALAVTVRGITLGEISLQNSTPAVINEVISGVANGAITGVILAVVATIWNGDPMLGFVLGIAMIVNLIIAGFFGAIVPLIMQAAGKDPATSATIFTTTATDVFGFFAFLGLASVMLL